MSPGPEGGASAPDKRVAIVTGATKGIGAGIAAAFSAAGYAVVGTARSVTPSTTPDVLMVAGDIAQAETAELVVRRALDRFGRIDTLVNNAGIYIGESFTDYTLEDYLAITSVNLTGFFHMTQRVIAQMVSQGGATSSTSAQPRRARGREGTVGTYFSDQGRAGGGDTIACNGVRRARRPRQRGCPRRH